MTNVTAKHLRVMAVAMAVAFYVPCALAQGAGGGKDKGPVHHEIFVGTYNNPGNQSAVVLGPFAAGTSLAISAITSVNENQSPIGIQFRALQPDDPPAEWSDCRNIPAGVFDEVAKVVVPAYSTVHQTFPEELEVPGDSNKEGTAIGEPSGPWCLVALADGLGIASDGDLIRGTVYYRVNEAE